MTVYDADAFDPLTRTSWDAMAAQEAIREIVADADAAYGGEALWPADAWDAWQTPTPLKALYVGAAGVVWALDALRRRDVAETTLDLTAAVGATLAAWRREPDLMHGVELPEAAQAGLLAERASSLSPTVSLCHGTAGNGYALLKTFTRTSDERWLERARAFAMHALEQTARLRRARGRGRYSLFTGDLGVAHFAADCLEDRGHLPIFETW